MPLGGEHGQRSSTLQPLFLEEPGNSFDSPVRPRGFLLSRKTHIRFLLEDAALDLSRESPRRAFCGVSRLRLVGHRLQTEIA